MPTLIDIVQQIRKSQTFDLRALESRVVEEISTRTGAKSGSVPGRPSIFVHPIPLEPIGIGFNLDTTIDWIVRRIQGTRTRTFSVSVGQQERRLVLIAQWERNAAATGT